ncbi:MAG: phosphohydrolase [Desulfosporosinus sp. BRH_c37]|nr:MAG: phosphohydrolase [Desulfosporosinus sp. BRH_c37]
MRVSVNIYDQIYMLAFPYLQTRSNEIHIPISRRFAENLLLKEQGDPEIVIPAILLHDVGWSMLTEDMQLKAFGRVDSDMGLNRIHEVEGVKIAKRILEEVGYNSQKTVEIINIIDEHDSRQSVISDNDRLVKDADKLFRYTSEGLVLYLIYFNATFEDWVAWFKSHVDSWFFTQTAKTLALKELGKRLA